MMRAFDWACLVVVGLGVVLLAWCEYGHRVALATLGLLACVLAFQGCGDDKPVPSCTNLRPAQIGELCGFDVEGYPAVPCQGFIDNDGCLVRQQAAGGARDLYCVALCTPGGDR